MADRDASRPALPTSALSFRGGFSSVARTDYEIGATYRHDGELLTSRDIRVATDNFAEPDIVAFFGREGNEAARSSKRSDDMELMFGPHPLLTVIARTQLEQTRETGLGDRFGDRAAGRGDDATEPRLLDRPWVTIMLVRADDSDPAFEKDEAVQRVARALIGARTLPAAEITRPGRYRGPVGVDGDGKLQRLDAE